MKKRAKIDYTFDDNFNNREDALTKETTVAGLYFARSIKAMDIRVDIVDRAIRNISKS